MKKTLLLAGVAALFSVNANATDLKSYVSVKGLYNETKAKRIEHYVDDYSKDKGSDHVWGAAFAYGVKADAFRGELEVNLHRTLTSKWDDGSGRDQFKNRSVMFNAYYDIDTGTQFTPYVGAGLGVTRLSYTEQEYGVEKIHKASNELTWQLSVGATYALCDKTSLDLGYRFVKSGDFKVHYEDGYDNYKITNNEFYFGVRYAF